MAVWNLRISSKSNDRVTDVMVEGDSTSTVEELKAELSSLGLRAEGLSVDGRSVRDSSTLADIPVLNGSHLALDGSDSQAAVERGRYLLTIAGPDSGKLHRLYTGEACTFGRSNAARFTVADPLLSSNHGSVMVNGGTTTLTDNESMNGTLIEGRVVEGSVDMVEGDLFLAGSTLFSVIELTEGQRADLGTAKGGNLPLPRNFRPHLSELPDNLDPPRDAQDDDDLEGYAWWRAAIPLLGGIGFALMTGRWWYLGIAALGPLVYGWDAQRRHQKRELRREKAKEKAKVEMAEFELRLAELRRAARHRRRETSNPGGFALAHSRFRHRRLWERRPDDPDFLELNIGFASLPSGVTRGRSGGTDDRLWGMPATFQPLRDGSLSLVGPPKKTRAATRAMLLHLAATHAPSDVRIWVLSDDDDSHHWTFARWLPHTSDGDYAWTIASTDADRKALARRLGEVQTGREERAEDDLQLPIHVVVVDSADLLPADDLARILGQGPSVGIVGIVVDAGRQPEGPSASIRFVDQATRASFKASSVSAIDELHTVNVDQQTATETALSLSPLRPAAGSAEFQTGGTVHLVPLADIEGIDGEGLVRRWESRSPDTRAVVGLASGVPMVIDIVEHGPHGLIGGTSGSGKTEFLKTYLMALCVNNSPDDLAIAIVDFKGGVDHEPLKALPHVLDVSTNLDVAMFDRTVEMIKAEQERRQTLFAAAGAQNLDTYRARRAEQPDLPAVPRFLVIVDEFSELLAHESGREKLKRLESIARVGRAIGVHLLLVTQSFEGQLPAQIDENAGLRISLRVGKESNSKAVLGSPLAATIPTSDVGRGYARLGSNGELVDFQTARVAGRHQEDNRGDDGLAITILTPGARSVPGQTRRGGDVPFEQSDMQTLLTGIRQAAKTIGQRTSPIPWPKTLPEHIPVQKLDNVVGRAVDGTVAVAVADNPSQQRQEIVALTSQDQQLLLIGGAEDDLPDVLSTLAVLNARSRPPESLHLYGIDMLGRGLLRLEGLPHCGAIASQNEPLAHRVLEELMTIAGNRKAQLAESGASTVWEAAAAGIPLPPQIILLVSGIDRLILHGEGTTSSLLAPIRSLLNESLGTGIQIVLSGPPQVAHNSLVSSVGRRFVFSADVSEQRALGVNRALSASTLASQDRFYDTKTHMVSQFISFATEQGQELEASLRAIEAISADNASSKGPRKISDVPWPLPMSAVDTSLPPEQFRAPLAIGVETANGNLSYIDGEYDGPAIIVAGTPRSGRTCSLAAMAEMSIKDGWTVVAYDHWARSNLGDLLPPGAEIYDDPVKCVARLEQNEADERLLFLVDDIDRVRDTAPIDAARERDGSCLIVGSGGMGTVDRVRSIRDVSGYVILSPTSSRDGFPLIRAIPDGLLVTKPGRGVLYINESLYGIQIPLPEAANRVG